MEETETTPAEPTAPPEAAQPEVPAAPEGGKAEPSALSPKDLESLETRLTAELVSARKAAQRAESKSDVVEKRAEARIRRLETQLEAIATRGMDENESRAYKAERELERTRETQTEGDRQRENEKAWQDFQTRGATLLAEEGIARTDPRLTAAFQKHAASATTTADWDIALARSIAEVHKDDLRKAKEDGKTAADRAREEERSKQKNTQRREEGPTDKGSPAGGAPKDWTGATDKEVIEELDRRRQRRIRAGL